MSTLNIPVKNYEANEKSYNQCGPYSKKWKSLKHLQIQQMEPVLVTLFGPTLASTRWFKYDRDKL
jgi:hypothetical protein